MRLRDIVVLVASLRYGREDHGARYAIELTCAHGCALTGLVPELIILPKTIDEDEEALARAADAAHSEAERAAEAFTSAATAAHIVVQTAVERSFAQGLAEHFADFARVRDLGILGISHVMSREERTLAEVALFSSGQPIVLVPEGCVHPRLDRILIAWDATPAIVHAIRGAMPLLAKAREVVVTSVTDDKAFRPGQSGVELCRHLARHDVQATFEVVQRGTREVAAVLLEAAQAHDTGLLVMGGYAHSTLRGLIFGSATKGILESPIPLPILMAH